MDPNATSLVLLPGLDGTDVFFRPLLASLPSSVRPIVVCYPGANGHGYADLLPIVRRAVAGLSSFYVLGWSFAGPLALMLAAAEPERARGVILSASFVRAPRRSVARLEFAMVGPVIWAYRGVRRLPLFLKRSGDPMRRAKAETWARVSARAVAARMRAVSSVDARGLLSDCRQPVLYIAASHDAVVPRHNVAEILRVRPSVQLATVPGRHLAMYTNPESASQAIVTFIAGGR